MARKILIIITVIIAGLLTGYFSRPIYDLVWNQGGAKPVARLGGAKAPGASDRAGDSKEFISKDDAINAVKVFPLIKQLMRVSELDGTKIEFSAAEPTGEYPVWLVEVRETHPDKLPVTVYLQVDAVTGEVLALRDEDFKIAGAGPGMTRAEAAEILGRPQKTRRKFESGMGQTVRTDSYEGLELKSNSRGEIIGVSASDAGYEGPRGIKTGETKADVLKKLGKAVNAQKDRLEYKSMESEGLKLSVTFDSSGTVTGISVEKVSS